MKKLIKVGKGIVLFLAFFLMSQLSPSFVGIAFGLFKKMHRPINNLTTFILSIAILVNVWLVLYIAGKCGLKLRFNFLNFETVGIIFLTMFSMVVVVVLGSALLHGETTENDKVLLEMHRMMPKIVMLFLAAIGAPIMEEITFRWLIISKLFYNIPWLGFLLSSLLFGLAHGPSNLGSWVIYGGIGCILGFVYMHTQRLEINICIHFLWNLTFTIITMLTI